MTKCALSTGKLVMCLSKGLSINIVTGLIDYFNLTAAVYHICIKH